MAIRSAASLLAATALFIAAVGVGVVVDRSSTEVAPAGRGGTGTEQATETLDEQLARVAHEVQRIRELQFEKVPEPTYLSPEELARRAAAFLEDYTAEDAAIDARILAALGAVERGTDLRVVLEQALSTQVAGFYDPDTGELVVGTAARGQRLGPLDEITLAHELEHALADQVLDLPLDGDEVPDGQEDAAFAAQSLVEGDATLTMLRYAEVAMSVVDQARLLAEQSALAADLAQLDQLPHVISRALTFPYEQGLAFVTVLHDRGGWAAVNEAYERPPATTLQVMRPELYLDGAGEAAEPPAVGDLDAPWQRAATLAMGAADLLFLFEAPGDDRQRALDDPRGAATAWRGGTVTLFTAGPADAVALSLVGEPPLCAAMVAWYGAAFPEAAAGGDPHGAGRRFDGAEQDAVVRCDGSHVRVGIAPDIPTAGALAA